MSDKSSYSASFPSAWLVAGQNNEQDPNDTDEHTPIQESTPRAWTEPSLENNAFVAPSSSGKRPLSSPKYLDHFPSSWVLPETPSPPSRPSPSRSLSSVADTPPVYLARDYDRMNSFRSSSNATLRNAQVYGTPKSRHMTANRISQMAEDDWVDTFKTDLLAKLPSAVRPKTIEPEREEEMGQKTRPLEGAQRTIVEGNQRDRDTKTSIWVGFPSRKSVGALYEGVHDEDASVGDVSTETGYGDVPYRPALRSGNISSAG